MSELSYKQKRFTFSIAQLIIFAYSLPGTKLTVGDSYRDKRVFGKIGEKKGYGHSRSLHKRRLAMDFNLFVDGKYMRSTEAFQELGDFWESLGNDHTWGGHFGDGNHFSITYMGLL